MRTKRARPKDGIVSGRIRLAREESGLNQTDLAAQLGIPPSTLGNWETGRTEPCLADLRALSHELRRDIGWFFGEDETLAMWKNHLEATLARQGSARSGDDMEKVVVLDEKRVVGLLKGLREYEEKLAADLRAFQENEEALRYAFLAIIEGKATLASGEKLAIRNPREIIGSLIEANRTIGFMEADLERISGAIERIEQALERELDDERTPRAPLKRRAATA